MVFGLPLAKLIPLVWKLITKPIEGQCKNFVKRSPAWRERFIRYGRGENEMSVKLRYWNSGIKRSSAINETKSIEKGVELVSTTVSFGFSLIFLVMWGIYTEREEQAKKDEALHNRRIKEQRVQTQLAEITGLKISVRDLEKQLDETNQKLDELLKSTAKK